MDCSTPGFPVHHQLPELAQTHVHPHTLCVISPCRPRLLLPSILPSIRDFSTARIRLLKYWSFSFSSFNKYSGLISLKIDFDLLVNLIKQGLTFDLLFKLIKQGLIFDLLVTLIKLVKQGLISLLSKGLSGVFSRITVQRHQLFDTLPFL